MSANKERLLILSASYTKDPLLLQPQCKVSPLDSWSGETRGLWAPGWEGIRGCRYWLCSALSSSQIHSNWEASQQFRPGAAHSSFLFIPQFSHDQFPALLLVQGSLKPPCVLLNTASCPLHYHPHHCHPHHYHPHATDSSNAHVPCATLLHLDRNHIRNKGAIPYNEMNVAMP